MAGTLPSTPQGFYVTQGNSQVFAQWQLVPGATGYTLQRSTDQITYVTVATLTTQLTFLDNPTNNPSNPPIVGTRYYYQVAATNINGTGAYTIPQNVVPATSGEMSLGELRTRTQQRADRLNSNFVTLPEWNSMINQSLFELYDMLITVYEDYFLDLPPVQFTTNGGAASFPLPDGVNTAFINGLTGAALPSAPPAFYKMWGVDLAANTSPTGWVTIAKFMPLDRNKYFYPNSQSTIYGVFNMQYRVLGMSQINFIPIPSGNQYIRMWYFPRMTMLMADSDCTQYLGASGWLEYVIVDAAIKALRKEQGWDTSALERDKMMLKQRIEAAAKNKDVGRPETIQDAHNSSGYGGSNGPGWSPGAGW